MTYLFNSPQHEREMLAAVGAESVDSLFDQIPKELQLQRPLNLPAPLTEMELEAAVRSLAGRNSGAGGGICFLGGGAYDHYIPAAVDEIAARGEFYTAYTPYQAEASQGSLQAFFEYQSLICELTGLDVSNASLYEGGTAVSEAAFMAMRVTSRHSQVAVLESVHPEYRQVLATYLQNIRCELVTVPTPLGVADVDAVAKVLDDNTACLIVQHPNFFGCLEPVAELSALTDRHGALSVISFDPLSVGILKRPGDYGADIAVAEGQPLGIPLQYGGPLLGILACRAEYVRKMPGRLVGQTVDRRGKRCYALNLQAREQHIRREKATSNICTNQGLLALRAAAYLSLVGKQGLREVAELCCQKAHYAAERLASVSGVQLTFGQPFFKEFTISCEFGTDEFIRRARRAGCDVGPNLGRFGLAGGNTQIADALLVAVTEKRTKNEIDLLAEALKG